MRPVTYYLTRNSNCEGELSSTIEIWHQKPLRFRLAFEKGHVWMAPNTDRTSAAPFPRGLFGSYELEKVRKWYRTIPDTDLELVRVDTQTAEPVAVTK